MERTNVWVAHRLPLVEAGLAATLGAQADMALRNDWQPAQGAAGLAGRCGVVVCDYVCGLALAAELKQQNSRARGCQVMLLSETASEWEIRQAVASGVLGFYLVNTPVERVLGGVRLLARGGRAYDELVSARIADCLLLPDLTEREREVLELIVEGSCNKEIARRLGIALGTVKAHVRALLDKLDVGSRVQAIVVAQERGMVGRRV